MKKYHSIIIVFLLTALAGCKEDFLDIRPIAAINSETFYTTQKAGEQAVTAIYSQLNNVAFDKDLIMAVDVVSDDAEAGGEYVNEVPSYENFNRMVPLTTQGELENVYGTLFAIVYFSNVAIEKLPAIKQIDKNADPKVIDRLLGEAKFMRALAYSYLTKYFGGVPLVDHVLSADEYYLPKAELKDLYAFIEQDLKDAIMVLPERSAYGPENIGRASKGAARALMARNLLFESSYARYYPGDDRFKGMTERWDEALKYAEDVINSGEYTLPGINGERYSTWRSPSTNGYRYVFTSNGDNTEGIFEIQDIVDGLGWAQARGNAITQYISARRYLDENGNPQNTDYWGLDLPTWSLINEFEPGDPRLRSGIAWDGSGDSIEIKGGKRYPISYDKSVTGTYCTKYECSAAEFKDINGPWHSAPINIKLIRYAEVLLIAAEAAMMNGQNDKALNYINMVRKRARMCGPAGNTVPADLTGTVTLENIIHERRVELYQEGHRYYDLVRWNKAKQYLNHLTHDGYQVIYESPKHDFLPLPQKEINANPNLKQYPGW
ncbi:MAG: RagB/SusD family nutrient uptake outer membrane protein [Bacteroidales bacterium]